MRIGSGRSFGWLSVAFLVAPHVVGCATTMSWEVTRRADELQSEDQIRAACGGLDACDALCESIMNRQNDEPQLTSLCESSLGDYSGIASCQPRGRELLITCTGSDDRKGACSMPDS